MRKKTHGLRCVAAVAAAVATLGVGALVSGTASASEVKAGAPSASVSTKDDQCNPKDNDTPIITMYPETDNSAFVVGATFKVYVTEILNCKVMHPSSPVQFVSKDDSIATVTRDKGSNYTATVSVKKPDVTGLIRATYGDGVITSYGFNTVGTDEFDPADGLHISNLENSIDVGQTKKLQVVDRNGVPTNRAVTWSIQEDLNSVGAQIDANGNLTVKVSSTHFAVVRAKVQGQNGASTSLTGYFFVFPAGSSATAPAPAPSNPTPAPAPAPAKPVHPALKDVTIDAGDTAITGFDPEVSAYTLASKPKSVTVHGVPADWTVAHAKQSMVREGNTWQLDADQIGANQTTVTLNGPASETMSYVLKYGKASAPAPAPSGSAPAASAPAAPVNGNNKGNAQKPADPKSDPKADPSSLAKTGAAVGIVAVLAVLMAVAGVSLKLVRKARR